MALHDYWIVNMPSWAAPGDLPGRENGGGKTPSAEALKLLKDDSNAIPGTQGEFPNKYGDLIYLRHHDGAVLMNGQRFRKNLAGEILYFYPRPEELHTRLAALQDDGTVNLGEIKRFVLLYEAAFKEKSDWNQVYAKAEIVDEFITKQWEGMDGDFEDHEPLFLREADVTDGAVEDPEEPMEPVGVEVKWGDPDLTGPDYLPVPDQFDREPCILL